MRSTSLGLLLLASIGCSSSEPAAAPSDGGNDTLVVVDDTSVEASIDTGRPGGGAPDCLNACCKNPTAGAACASADEGLECDTNVTCKGGLILPYKLRCASGAWKALGGVCDVGGGIADSGCPNAQPAPGSSCTLPEGTWCQYALLCAPKDCDAGAPADVGTTDGAPSGTGCAPVAGKVGPAFCRSGKWDTTPLGTCP